MLLRCAVLACLLLSVSAKCFERWSKWVPVAAVAHTSTKAGHAAIFRGIRVTPRGVKYVVDMVTILDQRDAGLPEEGDGNGVYQFAFARPCYARNGARLEHLYTGMSSQADNKGLRNRFRSHIADCLAMSGKAFATCDTKGKSSVIGVLNLCESGIVYYRVRYCSFIPVPSDAALAESKILAVGRDRGPRLNSVRLSAPLEVRDESSKWTPSELFRYKYGFDDDGSWRFATFSNDQGDFKEFLDVDVVARRGKGTLVSVVRLLEFASDAA